MPGLYLTNDLLLSSKVTGAAHARGLKLELVSSPVALLEKASLSQVDLVLLDLSTPGLDPPQLVPKLREMDMTPKAIVAYGPHVHEAKLALAAEAGCDEVLSQGQLHKQIDILLTRYLA